MLPDVIVYEPITPTHTVDCLRKRMQCESELLVLRLSANNNQLERKYVT